MQELLEDAGRDAGQMVEADISWTAVMSFIALKESSDERLRRSKSPFGESAAALCCRGDSLGLSIQTQKSQTVAMPLYDSS